MPRRNTEQGKCLGRIGRAAGVLDRTVSNVTFEWRPQTKKEQALKLAGEEASRRRNSKYGRSMRGPTGKRVGMQWAGTERDGQSNRWEKSGRAPGAWSTLSKGTTYLVSSSHKQQKSPIGNDQALRNINRKSITCGNTCGYFPMCFIIYF